MIRTRVIENGVEYDVENYLGNKYWYKAGTYILHREGDLPAQELSGRKIWCWNDKCHRVTGPAIIDLEHQYWWYHGKCVPVNSQSEFEQWLMLQLFI